MKRFLHAIALASLLLISCGQNQESSTVSSSSEGVIDSSSFESAEATSKEEPFKDIYKRKSEKSILADSSFKNGFYLISPESTNQFWEKDLDYGGEAETDFYNPEAAHTTYWQMCQWWTPYDFKDASFTKKGEHRYAYENESRYMEVDTEEGSFRMKLDSYLEYQERFGRKRESNESWSHFLIQQSFPPELRFNLSNLAADDSLKIKFDFKVDQCDYKGNPATKLGTDCAQLNFYALLYNLPPEGADPEQYGTYGARMWFGMPLYDSRYDTIPEYKAGDTGFEGATGHLIYSLPSYTYLGSNPLNMGQTYHVDFDATDYIKEAFIYAVQNNYLANAKWSNMHIGYMNFGWELPGEFAVDSTISNLDIYIDD